MAVNLETVRATAAAVAKHVAAALQAGGNALGRDGDCTVELGTVAGALRAGGPIGLSYVDLDVDLNPPSSSDGALDWTGAAHLIDLPGAEAALGALGPRRALLAPQDLLFFGTGNLERDEGRTRRELGLRHVPPHEVQPAPEAAARAALAGDAGYEWLLVHLDVDVPSYVDFPIAENVRRGNGMTLPQLAAALEVLLAAPQGRAPTVAEVNPDHSPDEAEALASLVAVLARALGRPAALGP